MRDYQGKGRRVRPGQESRDQVRRDRTRAGGSGPGQGCLGRRVRIRAGGPGKGRRVSIRAGGPGKGRRVRIRAGGQGYEGQDQGRRTRQG